MEIPTSYSTTTPDDVTSTTSLWSQKQPDESFEYVAPSAYHFLPVHNHNVLGVTVSSPVSLVDEK